VVGVLIVVDRDGCGHDSLAVGGDAVETGSWDFGYESVAAEFDDESADAFASSVSFVPVGGWPSVEAGGEVMVAEPADGVLAGHHGFEQGQVGRVERAEAGDGAPVFGFGPAQGVQGGDT